MSGGQIRATKILEGIICHANIYTVPCDFRNDRNGVWIAKFSSNSASESFTDFANTAVGVIISSLLAMAKHLAQKDSSA